MFSLPAISLLFFHALIFCRCDHFFFLFGTEAVCGLLTKYIWMKSKICSAVGSTRKSINPWSKQESLWSGSPLFTFYDQLHNFVSVSKILNFLRLIRWCTHMESRTFMKISDLADQFWKCIQYDAHIHTAVFTWMCGKCCFCLKLICTIFFIFYRRNPNKFQSRIRNCVHALFEIKFIESGKKMRPCASF